MNLCRGFRSDNLPRYTLNFKSCAKSDGIIARYNYNINNSPYYFIESVCVYDTYINYTILIILILHILLIISVIIRIYLFVIYSYEFIQHYSSFFL